MYSTRRNILSGTALTLASTMLPRSIFGFSGYGVESVAFIEDEKLKQLIQTAIDAATAAGASYADARLTFTQRLSGSDSPRPMRAETMGFGVRALCDGYWGFASTPIWNPIEAARLGHSAAAQAKANVLGNPREADLAPIAGPASGNWVMPVKDDPFAMAYEEISDFMKGLKLFIMGMEDASQPMATCRFLRQDKAFGNTLGQFTTQRLYRSEGSVGWTAGKVLGVGLDCLTPAGLGFEHFRDQPLRQYIEEAHAEAKRDLKLPVVPVDVGRYQTLIDARGVATAVSQSIGVATELDRAMGYEANAGGTSYIISPEEMLGTLQIGNPKVNILADRSEAGSVGRVRWDDEGVEPPSFTLIKDGVLANMQTNREASGWIKPHYSKTGQSWSSFGCAYAPDAIDTPLVHSADLHVHVAPNSNESLDALRQSIDKGVEWKSPSISMDFQQITGIVRGAAYEIRNGKRSARIQDAGMLFRTPELWGNLTQLGGDPSVRRFGIYASKGEPSQTGCHSVSAPPAIFKEMTFIDIKRKA